MEPQIVEYTAKQDRGPRRDHPAIKAGTKLWLIKYGSLYFAWAYVHKASAERALKNLDFADKKMIEFNFKMDPERSTHTWIE